MKIKSLITALMIASVTLTAFSGPYRTYQTKDGVQVEPGLFIPHAKIVGSLEGPDGTPHMKPGYQYHWETVYVTDDYGRVYAVDRMYLTYRGKRITE